MLEDHFYNIHRDKEFLEYKTLSFVCKRMIVDIIAQANNLIGIRNLLSADGLCSHLIPT